MSKLANTPAFPATNAHFTGMTLRQHATIEMAKAIVAGRNGSEQYDLSDSAQQDFLAKMATGLASALLAELERTESK